ncbi:MAG: hypothetical protein IKK24_02665, partial [Clostridia bacterium]|nr:hypothetical protein [Clostridia bacterium]
ITYISSAKGGVSTNTHNMVNNYDLGRQIQLSAYSGPIPFYAPGKVTNDEFATLGFNPIQAGDFGGYGSRVIAFYQTKTFMYIKTRPNSWPHSDVPGQCTFEFIYELVDNYVDVYYRINMDRHNYTEDEIKQISEETGKSIEWLKENNNEKQYWAHAIESPAVYVNGNWFIAATYTGTRPFTRDDVFETTDLNGGSGYRATEHWMAYVTPNEKYGLGVYNPYTTHFALGFGGERGGADGNDDRSYSSGYIGPLINEVLDYNITYDSYYALILGTVDEIRDTVYTLHGENSDDTHYDFTQNSRSGWHYGMDWGLSTVDKGYQNQVCLDFDLSDEGSTMYRQNIFFVPSEKQKLIIDAAFDSETAPSKEFTADILFNVYAGVSGGEVKNVTANAVAVFKADGERRKYEISLADYYAYSSAASCDEMKIAFSASDSDVHAKIYSVSLR